jgi:uncharacterized protein (DUF1330 family)
LKYYAVAEIEITDPSWVPDYVAEVTALVEQHGGRYLARTPKAEKIEGERPLPHVNLIIEWPSEEAAKAFYASEAYQPHLDRRKAGARNEFVLVAGEDVNGVARM